MWMSSSTWYAANRSINFHKTLQILFLFSQNARMARYGVQKHANVSVHLVNHVQKEKNAVMKLANVNARIRSQMVDVLIL